jgi:hypothetical protein
MQPAVLLVYRRLLRLEQAPWQELRPLFLAPPVEYAANAPASVERFLLLRVQAVIKRLKKLAEAWQPLYQTLTPDQKRRMAFLAIITLRDLRNGSEHRRLQSENDEEED